MGKISVLTQEQKSILSRVGKNSFLSQNFYFTGGTALSQFYLQHRFSDDLDFFSEEKFDQEVIFSLVSEWSKDFGFTFNSRFVEVVYRFELIFKNKAAFLVDFSYYPYRRVEKGIIFNQVEIDSLTDIAVNKLLTINQRDDVKDFVDLYFLLKKFTIWDLIYGLEAKFRREIDLFALAEDFLKIEKFTYLPRMIKPLTLEQLKKFFREKALEIGKRAVTK